MFRFFDNFFTDSKEELAIQQDSAQILDAELSNQILMRSINIDVIGLVRKYKVSIKLLNEKYTDKDHFINDTLLNCDLKEWLPTYYYNYHHFIHEQIKELETYSSAFSNYSELKDFVGKVATQTMKQKAKSTLVMVEVIRAKIHISYRHMHHQQSFNCMLTNIAEIELDKIGDKQLQIAKDRLNEFAGLAETDEKLLPVIQEWQKIAESVTLSQDANENKNMPPSLN